MRRLQKNARGSAIRNSPREPMAEGMIPLRENSQRNWSSMTDSQLIRHAMDLMKEKGMTGKKQLREADQGLYEILHRRKLLAKVGFEQKSRVWSSMTDAQLIQHAKSFMEEKGITGRGQLQKADPGLYRTLYKRNLLAKVRFEQKRRVWSSEHQLIRRVQGFVKENGITRRVQLQKAEAGLYHALSRRSLLEKIDFEQKKRESRVWASMSDTQVIQLALDLMKEKGITGKKGLVNADPGLYQALRKRKLLEKVGFERKCRVWSSMTDGQLIQHVRDFMKEKGITKRGQLYNADNGLYCALYLRNLLKTVGFEQKVRGYRDWSSMTDGQIVQLALDVIKEKGIIGRMQLNKIDSGLYEILRTRNLLSLVFAEIKQVKTQNLESELVSGLRQAADAMQEFAGSGKSAQEP